MPTISTLVVDLTARTASFQRGMGKGQKGVKKFSDSVTRSVRSLKRLAVAAVAAAGVGGLGSLIRSSMQSIDATAKMADRIGETTEALVGLRHGAAIMGVEATAFDKSLSMMIRRLGEVRSGSGEAIRGLEMLRLSADDLVKKSPAQAFSIIAERIKNLKTQADKSAAAYFLLGRSGMALVNMLELGAGGLKKMQREARELGLTFSRVDAAKVEAANDALTRMKGVFKGLTKDIAIGISPVIESLSNSVIGLRTESNITTASMVAGVEKVAVGVAYLKSGYEGLRMVVNAIGTVAQLALLGTIKLIDLAMKGAYALNDLIARSWVGEKLGFGIQGEFRDFDLEIKFWSKQIDKSLAAWGEATYKMFSGPEKTRAFFAKARADAAQLQKELEKTAKARAAAAETAPSTTFVDMLDKVRKTNEGLEQQIFLVGKSRQQAELLKIEKIGKGLVGDELVTFNKELARTKGLMAELSQRESVTKATEDLFRQGERLTEQFMSPLQKYETEVGKLSKLLKAGAISWDIFAQAMQATRKEFEGSGKALDEIQNKLADFGQFKEIRPAFVSLAGLSMGKDAFGFGQSRKQLDDMGRTIDRLKQSTPLRFPVAKKTFDRLRKLRDEVAKLSEPVNIPIGFDVSAVDVIRAQIQGFKESVPVTPVYQDAKNLPNLRPLSVDIAANAPKINTPKVEGTSFDVAARMPDLTTPKIAPATLDITAQTPKVEPPQIKPALIKVRASMAECEKALSSLAIPAKMLMVEVQKPQIDLPKVQALQLVLAANIQRAQKTIDSVVVPDRSFAVSARMAKAETPQLKPAGFDIMAKMPDLKTPKLNPAMLDIQARMPKLKAPELATQVRVEAVMAHCEKTLAGLRIPTKELFIEARKPDLDFGKMQRLELDIVANLSMVNRLLNSLEVPKKTFAIEQAGMPKIDLPSVKPIALDLTANTRAAAKAVQKFQAPTIEQQIKNLGRPFTIPIGFDLSEFDVVHRQLDALRQSVPVDFTANTEGIAKAAESVRLPDKSLAINAAIDIPHFEALVLKVFGDTKEITKAIDGIELPTKTLRVDAVKPRIEYQDDLRSLFTSFEKTKDLLSGTIKSPAPPKMDSAVIDVGADVQRFQKEVGSVRTPRKELGIDPLLGDMPKFEPITSNIKLDTSRVRLGGELNDLLGPLSKAAVSPDVTPPKVKPVSLEVTSNIDAVTKAAQNLDAMLGSIPDKELIVSLKSKGVERMKKILDGMKAPVDTDVVRQARKGMGAFDETKENRFRLRDMVGRGQLSQGAWLSSLRKSRLQGMGVEGIQQTAEQTAGLRKQIGETGYSWNQRLYDLRRQRNQEITTSIGQRVSALDPHEATLPIFENGGDEQSNKTMVALLEKVVTATEKTAENTHNETY